MHGLAVYVKQGLPFAWYLSLEALQILTYVFEWLYFTQCFASFSSIDHLLRLCAQFLILFHLTQIFLINTSANIFVFGDFNVHHKDWLTYSGRTDRPGELCYILSDLTQMINFPTQIPDYYSHSPALLDLFLSSDASICWLSFHCKILMMLSQFPLNLHQSFIGIPCFIAQLRRSLC